MFGVPDPSVKLAPAPALDSLSLAGKSFVVVGGTGGVGRALAKLAAEKGAKDDGVKNLAFVKADLSSMVAAKAAAASLPAADFVLLTTGTFAAAQREVTAEGLELDMAVSTLSRLVILRDYVPRLAPTARVFIWGMPGNGITPKQYNVEDLNAEKGYEPMGWTHLNTVMGNEALVHVHAARAKAAGAASPSFFGMNPGLISTAIRDKVHGGSGSCTGRVVEFCISLFTPSVETYAARILPLLVTPGLETASGAMFGPAATPIKPNAAFLATGEADKWYSAMEAVLRAKTGL